ncbi:MAG: aldolase/citrate lyase family protein, partial [Sphingomonas sp.]
LLDMGAYGIIAPLVNTVADVRRFADSLHYPPRGNRSFGPRRPFLRFGQDYLAHASDSVVSLAMIETKEGLANLDAILAEPGYDGVFIGPSDLALSLGLAPRPDSTEPVLLDAIEHIRARCHQTGKRAGLFCAEPAFARAMLAQGFDLVSVAPDLAMLTKAARQAVADVRAPD